MSEEKILDTVSAKDFNEAIGELQNHIKEIALAHDELQDKYDRLYRMVISHQHGKLGNPLFPSE